LLSAKLLFQSALFDPAGAKLIENLIVGAAQINSKNQNRRKTKNNKNKV
jgi:hypothetical protein